MIWAIRDPLRYAAEVAGVHALAAHTQGLTIGDVHMSETGQLTIAWDFERSGRTFQAALRYPQSFPAVPPTVSPRTRERWSGHQYGAGGELCLEWGPDNWVPTITGADMIASAVGLLGEEWIGDDRSCVEVPSRHATTLGQDLRGNRQRLIATPALEAAVAALDCDADARFSVRYSKDIWRFVVARMTRDCDEAEWADATIPLSMVEEGTELAGRILVGFARLPTLGGTATELRDRTHGPGALPASEDEIVLCVATDGSMSAAYLHHVRDTVFPIVVVPSGDDSRLPMGQEQIVSDRKVAVIGCGSLGSKVAVSLARSGISGFVLIDDDVLQPGNLVRNELDWSDVGLHKADALSARIKRIRPGAIVSVRRHRLGGQEPNGALDGIVTTAASCDLIVDATADGRAFNYAAAAAAAGTGRTMIWGEIFGGGYGGLVARSRPGLDPAPQAGRAVIEQWCRQQNVPAPRAGNDYDGRVEDAVMIADDASVSMIASVTASMAMDALLRRDPSRFPYSAYMIGMGRGWIFDEPFDTRPIDLGPAAAPAAGADYEDPAAMAALAELAKLVKTEGT